jgi:uncharacterized protein YmfQ (DUF2313 family)
MSASSRTPADFAALYLRLSPVGLAWPTESDAVQPQVGAVAAATFARLDGRASDLLVDAFPSSTVELLPDWESSLGLPDPCSGPDALISERQAHVVARLTAGGGLSAAFFVGYAATLGYTITITQFAPSRFGRTFGMPFGGPAWAYAWQVNAPGNIVTPLTFGGAFGSPFSTYGNAVLQCELLRLKPAHTTLILSY